MMKRMIGLLMMVGLMVGVLSGCTICKYASCYGSGKVQWDGNFVDGEKDGEWVWYSENGKVKEEGNFVDGKLEGKRIDYYPSGEVGLEKNYVDGKREGKWVWYDEDGNITDEDIWRDDKCVEMCEEGD